MWSWWHKRGQRGMDSSTTFYELVVRMEVVAHEAKASMDGQ
jgi:hypothetical protein